MRHPIANYGDDDYLTHGGFFVFDNPPDRPSIEILEEPCDDGPEEWKVYRFDMEPHTIHEEEDEDGRVIRTLSDNSFHPTLEPWYASRARAVAECVDHPNGADGLRSDLCSKLPTVQARAYQALVGYFGPFEFDQYPETLTREEIEERYANWPDARGLADLTAGEVSP